MTSIDDTKLNSITYRQATLNDTSDMVDVYFTSLIDLTKRMRQPTPMRNDKFASLFYDHVINTGVFYLALENDKIVGIAGAIIRDKVWFLSAFWVLPTHQNRGIGFPIVKKVYDRGVSKGCTIFTVYASLDYPAVFSYMKLGMYPGYPVFKFEGKPLMANILEQNLQLSKVDKKSYDLEYAIKSFNRIIDHEFLTKNGNKSYQVELNGNFLGFFYFRNGFIGPLVSKDSEYSELLLKLAINKVIEHYSSESISILVPGINHIHLKFLVENKFRIISSSYFLYSEEIGNLVNYIPSGAGLY